MSQVPYQQFYGDFRVLTLVGRGATGTVYAAEHVQSGQRVAIKALLPELSRSREAVSRFFHEARSATNIDDPGIVDVFDFGYSDAGDAYIAMELLHGQSLATRLASPPPPSLGFIRHVGVKLARTLGAAHAQQIVHRDLKPDNIFLVDAPGYPFSARIKVLDFGLAKLSPDNGPYTFVTDKDAILGTPLYMSPEQCRGGKIDARTDVYALGCILYELACGRPPFVQGGMGLILGAHVYEPVPRPRLLSPALPEKLEALLLRALAKQPDDRFASMHALALALDDALGPLGDGHGRTRAPR